MGKGSIKGIKNVTVGHTPQANPIDDIKKKISDQLNNYNEAIEEVKKIFKARNLRPLEAFRICSEIQAGNLEDLMFNTGEYIENEFTKRKL